jgi:hypothetical protein
MVESVCAEQTPKPEARKRDTALDPLDVIGGKPALDSIGVCALPPAAVVLLQHGDYLRGSVRARAATAMQAWHLVDNERQL